MRLKRVKNEQGLTLVELMGAIIILVILTTFIVTRVSASVDESKLAGIRSEFNQYEKASTIAMQGMVDALDTPLLMQALNRRLEHGTQFTDNQSKIVNPYGNPYKLTLKTEGTIAMVIVDTEGKKGKNFRLVVAHQGGIVDSCTNGFADMDKVLMEIDSDICGNGGTDSGGGTDEEDTWIDNEVCQRDGGSGSNEYIGIYTPEDLDKVRNNLSGKYRLMADIDLKKYTKNNTGAGWEPIGKGEISEMFSGVLDGNGFKVSGLRIYEPNGVGQGLIGTALCATVKNLTIEDAYIEGNIFSGVLAGAFSLGEVKGITVKNSVVVGDRNAGGVIGIGGGIKISNVKVNGLDVRALNSVGALIGLVVEESGGVGVDTPDLVWDAEITDIKVTNSRVESYSRVGGIAGDVRKIKLSRASVESTSVIGDMYVGGVVGYLGEDSLLEEVFVQMSELTGKEWVGGITGHLRHGSELRNSYANINVRGIKFIGGLVGEIDVGGNINNTYQIGTVEAAGSYMIGTLYSPFGRDITISEVFYNSEVNKAQHNKSENAKTTTEMKSKSTYTGWDFTTVWTMDSDNGYPELMWFKK